MTEGVWTARLRGRRGVQAAVVGIGVVLVLLVGGGATMAWGDGMRAEERLLPGTRVAGLDVGGRTVDAALVEVRSEVASRLAQPVTVTHGDRTWTTTPDALGATSDAEAVVADAFARTETAGPLDLVRARVGLGGALVHDVALDLPDDALADWIATIAADVDVAPQDAALAWGEHGIELTESVTGRRVDRDAAAAGLVDAVAAGASTLALPVEDALPAFPTEAARAVADEVGAAVAAAMDHRVVVTVADSSLAVTPRELGATHNGAELLAAGGATRQDVVLQLSEDVVHEQVVDEVLAPHEVAATDAQLAWTPTGGFAATPGETGLAVDHQVALAEIHAALLGASERVELELQPTQPSVTTDDFGTVLLVRQSERRVELYRGGEVVRGWDVAVGTSGHPTPTGMFTIGAKRFEPTWHNSSPDGWGRDMPLRIGPGPDNPLGLRALNWYQDGYDTLIRFHGTANEASIGRAASHGCVRMTNPDVIELYDLVDTGTVVVSVA